MNTPAEDAMENAIAAHFAESNDGAIMTNYFLVVKGKKLDEAHREITTYMVVSPDHSEYDQALGLAHYGVLNLQSAFYENEDDD